MEHQNLAQSLNFRALSQPVTLADRKAYQSRVKAAIRQPVLVYVIILAVVSFIAFTFASIVQSALGGSSLWPAGVSVAAFVAGGLGLGAWQQRRERRMIRLAKFATDNDLEVLFNRTDFHFYGLIFGHGHSRLLMSLLRLPGNVEVGNYQYRTGSGKNQATHRYGFVRIKLDRRLPHMVLDSRQNDLLGIMSNLPASFNRSQTLSLEGDFDRHFTLYAPKEYERDALYIFTPDVMRAMVDHGRKYDMEIVDNDFYIYSTEHFDLTSEAALRELFDVIDRISLEVRDQSRQYRDERGGSFAANTVAPQGSRLRQDVSVVALVIVALVGLFLFANNTGLWESGIDPLWVVGVELVVLWIVFFARKRH